MILGTSNMPGSVFPIQSLILGQGQNDELYVKSNISDGLFKFSFVKLLLIVQINSQHSLVKLMFCCKK